MKKVTGFILGFVLSNHSFALDNAVENIQALCGLAKQGKYAQIQSKAQLQADGSVKLASVGGKGEISLTKGEWDGVQQVLQAHQAGDNKDYRACVANALPYFKSKAKAATAKKVTAAPKKSVPVTKPESAKPDATKPAVKVETHGDKSPAINGDGATVNYGN